MELISHRVLELLQEQRQSQSLRVSAVFRQNSLDNARLVPGNYPKKTEVILSKYLDLVPVYPCDGILEQENYRRPFIVDVNGVSFYPKLDVLTSIVQTWMEEFLDTVRGSVHTGGKCEFTGSIDGKTIYTKKVQFDYSPNAAKSKKNINKLVQEIMRIKSMGQNIVFTCPGPSQRSFV